MGNRRSSTKGCRRRVGKNSRLSSKVGTSREMRVHGSVIWTSLRKGESMTGNAGWDVSLLPPVSVVSVPFLRPRSKVLNLSTQRNGQVLTFNSQYKESLKNGIMH